MPTITIDRDGTEFDCAEGDTVLRAALRAGIGMPYSCNVGSCGNCRFELIEGEVDHLRDDAPAWTERDLKRNRWLGCQAVPRGDCRIKFRADPAMVSRDRPARREAELVDMTKITRDISEFVFRVEGDDTFRPGQYALLYAPDVEGGRPYSMSNIAGDGTWRFLIKRVFDGSATGWLFEKARPGDRMTLDGPFGTAWLREDVSRDLVLLAGGSGLSPMISIAKGAEATGMLENCKLHLYYGARSQDDLFDPSDLLGTDLARRIAFTAALSEPRDGWDGPEGMLHDVVHEAMGARLKEAEIYFAGPAVMSTAVQKMAHEAGVPMDRLHFDEFY